MARTKKYLVTSKSSRGFYRPLRRGPTAIHADFQAPTSVRATVSAETSLAADIDRLEAQIAQAQALREELKQKIEFKPSPLLPRGPATTHHSDYLSDPSNTPSVLDRNYNAEVEDIPPKRYEQDFEKKLAFVEKEITHNTSKDVKHFQELRDLKETFSQEKKQMLRRIKELKSQVSQDVKVTENKFFTISKELQAVVGAMNQLVDGGQLAPAPTSSGPVAIPPAPAPLGAAPTPPQPTGTPPPLAANTPPATGADSSPATVPTVPETQPPQPTKETQKRRFKIPKSLLVLVSTLVIVGALGGGVWYFLNRDTTVDETLLQEYLPEDATQTTTEAQTEEQDKKKIDEPDSQTEPTPASTPTQTPAGDTLGALDSTVDASQAQISFADTKWDTLRHPQMGFEIDFPSNAVNVVKTETSVTFVRKTGYIFKIQFIETALDVQEYWKLIKATNLNYNVKDTSFREEPALFMELEDFSEYPGDKYLVKKRDFIYDIWYATYNKNLSDDDAKRIEIMLNSFKFTDKV